MYLSDLRVYFKVEVYFRVTWSGMEEYENRRKISGLCQHYQRWIYCWPEGLFHGWLIYSYFQIFKLIMCKWLPGECADWFFDIIMTWSHCLHRRYNKSRQKNSILINEHAPNREPVPLRSPVSRGHRLWKLVKSKMKTTVLHFILEVPWPCSINAMFL